MHTTVAITDLALAQLEEHLTSHAPERGGALLGLRNAEVITEFLADPDAATTAVSYVPSARLARRVREEEADGVRRFYGVAHSHPGRFDRPSGPDRAAFAKGLALNPHLATFYAPIITLAHPCPVPDAPDSTWPLAGDARLTLHAARRGAHPDEVELLRPWLRVLPIGSEVRAFTDRLAFATQRDAAHAFDVAELNGVPMITANITCGAWSVLFSFSAHYPLAAPLALVTPRSGGTRQSHLRWPAFGGSLFEAFHKPDLPAVKPRLHGTKKKTRTNPENDPAADSILINSNPTLNYTTP
jgi:proteasome lid subunit RPN8/RPN11